MLMPKFTAAQGKKTLIATQANAAAFAVARKFGTGDDLMVVQVLLLNKAYNEVFRQTNVKGKAKVTSKSAPSGEQAAITSDKRN